jgi:prepilin-type N-terminal cleavage/methylation domain-containing protein
MKLETSFSGCRPRAAANAGFTLMELLVAMFIFVFVLMGILYFHVHGLKMFQITETKLNVLTWSRETVGRLTDEVRSSADVEIGNKTNGPFIGLLPGETQQGNAILIVTTNVNSAVSITNIYFVGPSNQLLVLNSLAAVPNRLAQFVTNSQPFSLQNFSGETLTNRLNNGIIHMVFEFYQPERYLLGADYYKLETSVSRRVH